MQRFVPLALVLALPLLQAPRAAASAVGPQLAEMFFHDAPADCEWHLQRTGFVEAWRLSRDRGVEPGANVVIAFPDTGFTRHPEMLLEDGTSPTATGGWDYLDDDDDPNDDLYPKELIDFPGHATQALSVIVSPRGPAHGARGPFVSGAAPAARILPLRVGRSVFITDATALADSLHRAVDEGAHVILLARGAAIPSREVERELERAHKRGVIVIAAAGNGAPFVVYPARIPGVIAVGASDAHDQPWTWSSPGPEVVVSAPGANVWAAYPYRGALFGGIEYLVMPAGGTTIASSLVASAAAMWLSYHGREALIARYGAAGLVDVFRRALADTARRPAGWPTHTHGAGILDVSALLRAPLEDHDLSEARRAASTDLRSPVLEGLAVGQHRRGWLHAAL